MTGAPIHLQFDDNHLLAMLYGEHDRHLSRIEQELGVSLSTRGNRLAITGPEDASESARAVLSGLYERLKRELPVSGQEVDAALRIALGEGGDAATVIDQVSGGGPMIQTRRRTISPRSPMQGEYITALADYEMVFGVGPAGTGKTYLAVAMAVQMLLQGQVERIVLSRPAVEAGERLGFLPGDMREKIDPYLQPLYDALYDNLPREQVDKKLESGEIEIAPLAFMRGRTLSNAYVILDEAQNTAPMQMKMFLTRLGDNSRMAITGDLSQVDLPGGTRSGLADALEILEGMEGVGVIRFTDVDVVRHTLVARIVRAYDRRSADQDSRDGNKKSDSLRGVQKGRPETSAK